MQNCSSNNNFLKPEKPKIRDLTEGKEGEDRIRKFYKKDETLLDKAKMMWWSK